MSDTNGLRYLPLEEITLDSLQWLQAEYHARLDNLRRARMIRPGWFGSRNNRVGRPRYGWVIVEDGSTGKLTIQTVAGGGNNGIGLAPVNDYGPTYLAGIDPNGKSLEVPIDDDQNLRDEAYAVLVVPNDGVTYTLVARQVVEVFEPGTIDFVNGSGDITGHRTDFTRYNPTSDGLGLATILRVDGADSAPLEGEYTLADVTDATTATITPAPTANGTRVRFRVKGRFYRPPGVGEPLDVHLVARTVWELRARVTGRPTDAIVAYDCTRTGGTLVLLDRRWGNEYREMPEPGDGRATISIAKIAYDRDSDSVNALWGHAQNNLGSADVLAIDVVPSGQTREVSSGREYTHLQLIFVDATDMKVKADSTLLLGWSPADSPVTILSSLGTVKGMAAEQVPADSGFTHLIVWSAGGLVKLARMNDTTLVSQATIWDPTSVDSGDTVEYPSILFTQGGRVIVCAVFKDAADSDAKSIRSIQSDDYGVTWDTNGDAGVVCVSATNAPRHTELAQDGYGMIHGAYVEDNAAEDEVWIWHGSGIDSAEIANNQAQTNNRGTKLWSTAAGPFTANNIGQPRMIGWEDGSFEVAWAINGGAGGSQTIQKLVCKENDVLRFDTPVTLIDSADYAGPTYSPVGFEVTNGGFVRLAWVDTDAVAAGDLDQMLMHSTQLAGGAHWPGGS